MDSDRSRPQRADMAFDGATVISAKLGNADKDAFGPLRGNDWSYEYKFSVS